MPGDKHYMDKSAAGHIQSTQVSVRQLDTAVPTPRQAHIEMCYFDISRC